jgi:hypothetical protein
MRGRDTRVHLAEYETLLDGEGRKNQHPQGRMPHMSLTLTRQQMVALLLLAFFTILVLGTIITASVTHTDVWHLLSSFNVSTALMTPHS